MKSDLAFDINPKAAHLRREKDRLAINDLLKKRFGKYNPTFYYSMKDARLNDHSTLVFLGGDGTVHVTIQHLAHLEDRLLGYIPLGTGKDFCKALNIHYVNTSVNCIEQALMGDERYKKTIDVGKATLSLENQAEEVYFLGACGIGIDGDVVHRLEHKLQKVKHIASVFRRENNRFAQNIGKAVYNLAVLYTLVKFKPQDYIVAFNDELFPATYLDAFSINVSKVPTTGGGIMVCPDAKQDNGYFDVCIVSEIGKLNGISVLGKANKGNHLGEKGVFYLNETDMINKVSIESTSGNPFALHFSGEPYVCQKVVLQIAPQKVKVIHNPN